MAGMAAFILAGTPGATDMALVVVLKGEQSTPLPVTVSGGLGSTSVVTRVAVNVANVTLKAANAARRSLTITNLSTVANLFIKYGATADIGAGTESFTVAIPKFAAGSPANGYFIDDFDGIVDGIWDAADAGGEALVTEVTA